MYIVLGSTGHIGSTLTDILLQRGKEVLAVTHDPAKKSLLEKKGATAVAADVFDTGALREVFRQGKRLFLLNPPADPSADIDAVERKSVSSIITALKGSGLDKVVAESSYGAQAGEHIGDLGVLYELEQALAGQEIPYSIMRGAYYMTNWDFSMDTAKNEGKIYTFFPPDFKIPMVAPQDIARLAAKLLTEDSSKGPYHIAGPEDYSPNDVAAAFANALGKPVEAVEVPRSRWQETFIQVG